MENCNPEKANVDLSFASVDIGLFGKFLFWKKSWPRVQKFLQTGLERKSSPFLCVYFIKNGWQFEGYFPTNFPNI